MQKCITPSMTKDAFVSGTGVVQDMMFASSIVESIGFEVKLWTIRV
jgi:hypothetical protein